MGFAPKKIIIYSVGLLGGAMGLALKESGFKGEIFGLSSSKNLQTAMSLGCIDKGYPYEALQDVLPDSDLLLLCSPITRIIATIKELQDLCLPTGLLISDVGSTKRQIMETANALPSHVNFIGGHPMAGSERSGPSFADPYLFQNATYVLTPVSQPPGADARNFAEFLERYLGCRCLFLDPAIHDNIAAAVSHVPHLLAVALVNLVREQEEKIPGTLDLAAGGFRDMTRIASAAYDMWRDILQTNKSAIEPLLDALTKYIAQVKTQMRDDSIEGLFKLARDTRTQIPLANKGFIHTLSEIVVVARDHPGELATLCGTLAEKNINIKDIEVMKVREGEGGTIRLAFENPAIAREAIAILSARGFIARERN